MNLTLVFFLGPALLQLILLNRFFFALIGSPKQNKGMISVHFILSGLIIFISSISFFPVLVTGILSLSSAFIISLCYSARMESKIIFSILYVILGFVAETISYGLILWLEFASSTIDLGNQRTRLLILLFSSLIFFSFIGLIKIFKRQRDYKLNISYYLVMAFIHLISLLILNTLFFYAQENSMYIFSAIGILLINITIIYLFDEIIENFQMKDALHQLHKQTDYQSASYQKISNSFQMTKRIIHDTNKHFVYIRACIQTGELEKGLDHISKSLKLMENSYLIITTGNLVIDALLNNAISISNEKNIRIRHQVSINNLDTFDSYDLCIVLGNILDNAIEAVQLLPIAANRLISIHMFSDVNMLTIHIKNSYSPVIKKNSKKNAELHGVGLLNIQQITEKYGGHLSTIAGETFETIVVLPNRECKIKAGTFENDQAGTY